MKRWAKTILRVWLISWVMTLPLVHAHPEADHSHGIPGHAHGGAYHTVVACGWFCDGHDQQPLSHHQSEHHHAQYYEEFLLTGKFSEHSHSPPQVPHDFEHTTFEFSALKSWADEDSEGPTISFAGLVPSHQIKLGLHPASSTDAFSLQKFFALLWHVRSPRAPPLLNI